MFDLPMLPIDVYHVIHQYLLNYDYHEFLNTSKAVFSELKYRTMHYHLRFSDPFDQADAGIISDIVSSKVMNKRAQIFVTFKFDCYFDEASVVNSARLNLQIPVDVHTLKLQECYHNDNLRFTGREGGHLHTLEIYGKCGNDVEYDFSSISATFPFLQKLVVNNCRIMSVSPLLCIPYIKIKDVVMGIKTSANLSNTFHDVNLHQTQFHYAVGCPYTAPLISTLSSFKDVQDLSLQGDFVSSNSSPGYYLSCHSLTLINLKRTQTSFPLRLKTPIRLSFSNFDLTNLVIDNITKLEEVSLHYCSSVDMTLFRNAKKITIEQKGFIGYGKSVKMSDLISFQFLSDVSLVKCDIVDVSLFSDIRTVELNHCSKLASLQGLGMSTETRKGNREVTVANCDGVTDFSPLNGVRRVDIHSCVGFTDGNQVKDVNNLKISFCDKLESFHMFGNAHSLRIEACRHLATLSGLQDVPFLQIVCCNNLKDIKGLKNNQYVEIYNCRSLNRERKYYKTFFSFLPHFIIT
jgi:hypothetical protein